MLSFSSHLRYFIYCGVADLRKGYDGLSGLVRNELHENPLSGDVFVFFNRNRRLVKMLIWDKDGYVIYAKRLERGQFELVTGGRAKGKYPIQYQHLVMLLSGISLIGMKQKPRYKMVV